jgi:hypothetical protein
MVMIGHWKFWSWISHSHICHILKKKEGYETNTYNITSLWIGHGVHMPNPVSYCHQVASFLLFVQSPSNSLPEIRLIWSKSPSLQLKFPSYLIPNYPQRTKFPPSQNFSLLFARIVYWIILWSYFVKVCLCVCVCVRVRARLFSS